MGLRPVRDREGAKPGWTKDQAGACCAYPSPTPGAGTPPPTNLSSPATSLPQHQPLTAWGPQPGARAGPASAVLPGWRGQSLWDPRVCPARPCTAVAGHGTKPRVIQWEAQGGVAAPAAANISGGHGAHVPLDLCETEWATAAGCSWSSAGLFLGRGCASLWVGSSSAGEGALGRLWQILGWLQPPASTTAALPSVVCPPSGRAWCSPGPSPQQ